MKLKKAIGFISPKYKESTICENCGGKFTCGATIRGCWCMKVKLTEETRRNLKTKFKDCLCQKCLETFNSQFSG